MREMPFMRKIDEDDFMNNLKVGIQLKERLKAVIPAGAVRLLKNGGDNGGKL